VPRKKSRPPVHPDLDQPVTGVVTESREQAQGAVARELAQQLSQGTGHAARAHILSSPPSPFLSPNLPLPHPSGPSNRTCHLSLLLITCLMISRPLVSCLVLGPLWPAVPLALLILVRALSSSSTVWPSEFTLKAAYTHEANSLAVDTPVEAPVSPTRCASGGAGGGGGGGGEGGGGGGALERENTGDSLSRAAADAASRAHSVSSSYRCSASQPAPGARRNLLKYLCVKCVGGP
jgi:hypothetical protein